MKKVPTEPTQVTLPELPKTQQFTVDSSTSPMAASVNSDTGFTQKNESISMA